MENPEVTYRFCQGQLVGFTERPLKMCFTGILSNFELASTHFLRFSTHPLVFCEVPRTQAGQNIGGFFKRNCFSCRTATSSSLIGKVERPVEKPGIRMLQMCFRSENEMTADVKERHLLNVEDSPESPFRTTHTRVFHNAISNHNMFSQRFGKKNNQQKPLKKEVNQTNPPKDGFTPSRVRKPLRPSPSRSRLLPASASQAEWPRGV